MSIMLRLLSTVWALTLLLTACQSERVIIETATPDINIKATFAAAMAATEAVPIPTPILTPTPDPFPTPVIVPIYLAEQRFEGGWMFWLQPNQQIWLLTVNDDGENIWSVYDDTFVEGDAESDPDIVPPEGMRQPIRGFGKLWRENLEVRTAIGWALEAERGSTTRYEYHHGGDVDAGNQYISAPGYHLVESMYGDIFRLNEPDSSWQIVD